MKWFICQKPLTFALTTAELVQALSITRHEFLNDLQVISGWLQLGRGDSAGEYLDGVAERLAAESRLHAIGDAGLEASFALARLLARDRGVDLVVEVETRADAAYLATAAAAREASLPRRTASFSRLLLEAFVAVLGHFPQAGDTLLEKIEATLSLGTAGVEVVLRLTGSAPQMAVDLDGLVQQALRTCGFAACEVGLPPDAVEEGRVVGVGRRQVDTTAYPAVAEGSADRPELVVVMAGAV